MTNGLTRNYIEEPLKRGELPNREDMEFLFLTCNYSRSECAISCNCAEEKIKQAVKLYGLKKTPEQRIACRNRTNLIKYGVSNISQSDKVKEKKKATTLKHYGVENPAQSKEVYQKIKETCIDKYGVESTNMLQEKKDAVKSAIVSKYGVENVMHISNIKDKQKQTVQERYGVDNIAKSDVVQDKKKQTCLERYDNETVMGSDYFKQKSAETSIERYGCENIMQTEEMREHFRQIKPIIVAKIMEKLPQTLQKSYNTKKANKSFNTSGPELAVMRQLQKRFTVIGQYKTEEYPFACDFYLPQLDLYIEFHGNWTHGGVPYEDNDYCRKQLIRWEKKAETSDYYKGAIYTWTDLDVRKRQIAEKNGLNWVCFYTLNEFKEWFKYICDYLN